MRLLSIFIGLMSFVSCMIANEERKIVLVIASYNNQQWYKKNLDSVFVQKYSNYHVIYTDDASPDKTGNAVEAYIKQVGKEDKVTLIKNTERKGALANQYHAIHSCSDKDIIAILDGDDWLPHENVLSYLNKVYSDQAIWLTYGQFIEHPSDSPGFCCAMPKHIVSNSLFRQFRHIPSHMRTFYAGLFKRIRKEDLCDAQGNFLMITGDIAAMFPMIEMACDHFKFVSDVIYVYNGANELNDHKVYKGLQREVDLMIRSRPRYEKLAILFEEGA